MNYVVTMIVVLVVLLLGRHLYYTYVFSGTRFHKSIILDAGFMETPYQHGLKHGLVQRFKKISFEDLAEIAEQDPSLDLSTDDARTEHYNKLMQQVLALEYQAEQDIKVQLPEQPAAATATTTAAAAATAATAAAAAAAATYNSARTPTTADLIAYESQGVLLSHGIHVSAMSSVEQTAYPNGPEVEAAITAARQQLMERNEVAVQRALALYKTTGQVTVDFFLAATENWIHGQMRGTYTSYYANGQIKHIVELKKRKLKDVEIVGVAQSFFANGQLQAFVSYQDDQPFGPIRAFYPNGQIFIEGFLINGSLIGPYHEFYENGKPRVSIDYLEYLYGNGIKKHRETYYAPDGSIIYDDDAQAAISVSWQVRRAECFSIMDVCEELKKQRNLGRY